MSESQSRPQSAMDQSAAPAPAAWAAVISMTLGVFGLVTAEFLPVSLLTPMADDLRITEGMAGQAMSATAVMALITSLLTATVTRKIDRRYVLLGFSVLLIAANIMIAQAPNYAILLAGRVLLGVALGGFWTMSAAIIMRLVPEKNVPRALAILFSGVSAATVFAAPLGSYLGDVIGWRNVFMLASLLGVLALVVQFATLPKMPPRGRATLRTLIEVINRPRMKFGLFSLVLIITGHFALFTYVRPFLENVSGVTTAGISGILLGFGVANFIGTYVGGALIARSLRMTIALMPMIMGLAGVGMVAIDGAVAPTTVLVAIWGMAFGGVPVAWSTWITRTVPDEAESGGGLLVAGFQLAIATGAAVGGLVFDTSGALGVFTIAGFLLLGASIIVTLGLRTAPVPAEQG
ncbi:MULTISPECIES: MFS transporter [Thalassospira]|uniref:Major facilitator transporter n=2 Tax=Thalassospira tepidiphila TaxID=393657 RepID=A0A853KXN5_9PROT|nr:MULTISPECIES: MFS transporter [Thalassospira]MBE70575.1 MFS transporter [Thalassospira sp.]NJB75711.1 putative MFS family arabinose efflux permease [Thalassospira tepidiphila]OAZ08486.1 major facilitator transporter [Thalassospira tepidiphila MCCC 1A03514]